LIRGVFVREFSDVAAASKLIPSSGAPGAAQKWHYDLFFVIAATKGG
jgi:hypothetical protein